MAMKNPPKRAKPAPKKKPARRKAVEENTPQKYEQAGTTVPAEELLYPAGREPTALTAEEVDPEAAAKAEDEANARVEREKKYPPAVPDLSSLSPNQRIALAQAGAIPAAAPAQEPSPAEEDPNHGEGTLMQG